jgi:hypothetical protein
MAIEFWVWVLLSSLGGSKTSPSLGGTMWYVHFASLFYIIIYCYSLIYFIFRDDSYVVSSVFTCLMIIGELAVRVRILLEKRPSRHHISEDQQFQENTQKFIFHRKTEVARRRGQGEPPGAHTTRWRGPALGRATQWCGRPGPPLPAPPHVYRLPKKPKTRGGDQR